MQLGCVLFEEIEVCCARDVTFVLPDCYVRVTWEQRKLGAGHGGQTVPFDIAPFDDAQGRHGTQIGLGQCSSIDLSSGLD